MTIRVGLIGANSEQGWSAATHLPALAALDEFSLAAVCTTRAESARSAADRYDARHAFTNPGALAGCADVDLVVISVRAPRHAALVEIALAAGKPVFCEWPLGVNLEETARLAARARAAGIRSFVGLQGRASPAAAHARDLIGQGYVGSLLSVTMTGAHRNWGPVLAPRADYVADAANGVTVPTIVGGHAVDMMCALAGELTSVCGLVDNRRTEVRSGDTGAPLEKTAPDQFLFTGQLACGAPVAVHLQGGVCERDAFALEVRGTEGTLRLSTDYIPEILPPVLAGTREPGAELLPISVPSATRTAPESLGSGPAVNVAQLYGQIGRDLREGTSEAPDFDHGLRRRESIEAVTLSSRSGRRQSLNE